MMKTFTNTLYTMKTYKSEREQGLEDLCGNQQRELIRAQKMPHQHNNKNWNRLQ